ncbi:leucyl aminopeptidase family protein [Parvularcula maris]|uniref:Leucyl aminopeptidase family protein n=1 Tax=Parvularcula maris TaxID=2965077 RepID=A0A9X2RIS5_9PROT|nr:leucyl aminopeptidase family protein [Parvularcula maris]MCQ8185191.1 leucyl aminopeptidase family protein [Parvularcula maris]
MTKAPISADRSLLEGSTPLHFLSPSCALPEGSEAAARLQGFTGEREQIAFTEKSVLVGVGGEGRDPLAAGAASLKLPSGTYSVAAHPQSLPLEDIARGFALGAYRFHRYAGDGEGPRLVIPQEEIAGKIAREAASIFFGRDLINTPAEDMGPDALEDAARRLAGSFGADIKVYQGDGFAEAFPLIHAVGRAAGPGKEPRLIELNWAGGGDKRLALIGKGVCFDSGGLNIKGGKSMGLMKKDMGGAATSLALARRLMEEGAEINLRLLIPAVENAVSGNSFRPGDVFRSRLGKSVEISNTDAEGRLILADAMALALEGSPDRMITLATLTGAARVALGPDLPPIYSTEPQFQEKVLKAGRRLGDPMWPMPFWERYESFLASDIADINHAASTPFAGSITAALFLKGFAGQVPYTHIDTFAWVPSPLPGRPKGGEVLCLRALTAVLMGEEG